MKTYRWSCMFAVLFMAIILGLSGQSMAYAAENEGVVLYKNEVKVGDFATVNAAFDKITDANADYVVALKNEQTLTGYANWPKAKSIKITLDKFSTEEYGYIIPLYLVEKNITFHSDICLSDWIYISPDLETATVGQVTNINLQGYEWTFTEEVVGHNVEVGDREARVGIHIVGDEGSKLTIRNSVQFWGCSMQVDTLELVHYNGQSGACASMTMMFPVKDSKVNRVISAYDPVIPIKAGGFSNLKTKFTIQEIEFQEQIFPTSAPAYFTIESEGMIDIEVGTVPSDAELRFVYTSDWSVESGNFSYTGKQAPKNILVQYYITSLPNGMTSDVEWMTSLNENHLLLYAPHVPYDRISFTYGMQNNLGNDIIHSPYYEGSLPGDKGYYYTDAFPWILPEKVAYIIDKSCSKTLTYMGANENGDLKSVTWTASNYHEIDHTDTDVTDAVIKSYDSDSVNISLNLSEPNIVTWLTGCFDYGYGTLRINIPVFSSVPVSNVSFSTSELVIEYNEVVGSGTVELNYTAEEEPVIILTTDTNNVIGNIVRDGKKVHIGVKDFGTGILRAYVGTEVIECKIIVKGISGWHSAANFEWFYYEDGEVDTSVNGLIPKGEELWYTVNGRMVREYCGLVEQDGTWYYVEWGIFYPSFTGLVKHNDDLYYVENGIVNWNYNGLGDYQGNTYEVRNGIAVLDDSDFTGLEYRDGSWYYIENGVINYNYTGLYCDANLGWWLVVNGQIAFDYTGLYCDASYGWWLVKGGAVAFDYTGLWCDANYGWWLVGGGAVCFDYTGLWCDPNYGWWLVGGGAVCFDYTGLWCDPNYGWWLIGGGAVCFDYTGLWCDPNYGWWLIGGGAICFDYTGLWCDPNYGWWYIEGGALGLGYSGVVYYDGVPYNVVNGALV